ncbi:Sporulation membrane protein YtrI [compost metagenome]
MRVPSFERYKSLLSGTGIFIAGMIVGAAVFLSVYQEHLSILHERVGVLSNQNKTLQDSMEGLNKYKQNQQYIGRVKVMAELAAKDRADANVVNELERRVYEDIKLASGKPVSAVREAPDIFRNLVDKKVYRNVYGKDYQITVRHLMVIQTEFTLYISCSEYAPSPA